MGHKWLQACARASAPKTTIIAPHGLCRGIGLSQGCVRLGDEGPLGASVALCTRAVPIRAELAAASARLGPERVAETLLEAQKRLDILEFSQKRPENAPRPYICHKKKVSPRLPVGLKRCVLEFSTIYAQNQALNKFFDGVMAIWVFSIRRDNSTPQNMKRLRNAWGTPRRAR